MTLTKTKIDWCDYSWNPVTGCSHGCYYCYARKIAERFRGSKAYPNGFQPTFHKERIRDPCKLHKPSSIFVCSMGDLFGEWVPTEWIIDVFKTVTLSPLQTFLFLTKNPQRMQAWAKNQKKVWWGTTVTGIGDMERIGQLQKCNSENLFVSFEPLLGVLTEVPDLTGIKGIIIGAQTNPVIMPPTESTHNIVLGAVDTGAKIFYKNSMHYQPELSSLPWTVHKMSNLSRKPNESPLCWGMYKDLQECCQHCDSAQGCAEELVLSILEGRNLRPAAIMELTTK